MSLPSLVLYVLLAHLYVHLGVVLALYLAPVERFEAGQGYRFWPESWRGRLELAAWGAIEFWAFYLFMLTWPLGWLVPRRVWRRPHPEPADGRNVPVVLVHGYRMNSFCMEPLRMYLRRQGFRRLYSLSLRRLDGPIESFAGQLAQLIRQIDEENPGEGVFLVGHSMGGLVSALTLQDPKTSGHVRGVVAIGSPFGGTVLHCVAFGACARQFRPAGIFVRRMAEHLGRVAGERLVSIYSEGDRLVLPASSARVPGALANLRLTGLGHMSLLLSPTVLRLVRDMLLGQLDVRFPERARSIRAEAAPEKEHDVEHSGEERDPAPHP
jgi:triacylglycerol lipase